MLIGDEERGDFGGIAPAVPTQVGGSRRVDLALQRHEIDRERLLHSDQKRRVVREEQIPVRELAHERADDDAQVLGDLLERHPLDHEPAPGEVAARVPVILLRVEERVAGLPQPRLAVRDDRVVPAPGVREEVHSVVLDDRDPMIVQDVAVVRGELRGALDHRG